MKNIGTLTLVSALACGAVASQACSNSSSSDGAGGAAGAGSGGGAGKAAGGGAGKTSGGSGGKSTGGSAGTAAASGGASGESTSGAAGEPPGGAAGQATGGGAGEAAGGTAGGAAGDGTGAGGSGATGGGKPPKPGAGQCTWVLTDPSGTTTTDIHCHWDNYGLFADGVDAPATAFSIQGFGFKPGSYPIKSSAFGILNHYCFGSTCSGELVVTANDASTLSGTFSVDLMTTGGNASNGPDTHIDGAFAAACDGTTGGPTTCPN